MVLSADSKRPLPGEFLERRKAFHAAQLLVTFENIRSGLEVALLAGALFFVASALAVAAT